MYEYSLRISVKSDLQKEQVNKILGIESNIQNDDWEISVMKDKSHPHYINYFLDILENKYNLLKECGIFPDDISIWILYEYSKRCRFRFSPEVLLRLGKQGVALCISC